MAQQAKTPVLSADTKELKYLLSAIAACDSFAPVWETVAKDQGILYGKNASRKFRDLVQKYGYEFEGGKLTRAENGEDGDKVKKAKAAPKTPGKAIKSEATPATPKKRKVEDQAIGKNEGDDAEDGGDGDGNDER